MKILLIGSGGREHAIAWKMAQSPKLNQLFIAPGNAGTSQFGTNVELNPNDHESVKQFITEQHINAFINQFIETFAGILNHRRIRKR